MKKILVVADPYGAEQRTVVRAAKLGAAMSARLDVVGFVYEHLANLPVELEQVSLEDVQAKLVRRHEDNIAEALGSPAKKGGRSVRVFWEKRVAERVAELAREGEYDLVVKGGHRSETLTYTPTDWQLLRSCRAPVLLLSAKLWRRSNSVMAAVDLGTKVKSKIALNFRIVEEAAAMAAALESKLHVAYAVPFSGFLRDLGLLDRNKIRREGVRRAEAFRAELDKRGIEVEAVHVAVGQPEKCLVSLAAKNKAELVVLGCVGRRELAGRVIGNTAEQILRLMKANVLALKP